METVICELCKQPIGKVDKAKLKLPLTPDQFKSIDSLHGVPDPFHPDLKWLHFRCPFCHYRPFYEEDHLTFIQENSKPQRVCLTHLKKKLKCKKCGRELKHQSSLSRHEKKCHGKKHS